MISGGRRIVVLGGPLVLDLFADDSSAKCPAWYTAEVNALTQDWSDRLAELPVAQPLATHPGSCSQYHEKAGGAGHDAHHELCVQQRENGGRYVFLLLKLGERVRHGGLKMPITSVLSVAVFVSICRPRFVPADDKQKPTSAFFAGAIVIFDKSPRGERFLAISIVSI